MFPKIPCSLFPCSLFHPGNCCPQLGQTSIWHKTYLFLKPLIGVCFNELWHELAQPLAIGEQLNKQIFK